MYICVDACHANEGHNSFLSYSNLTVNVSFVTLIATTWEPFKLLTFAEVLISFLRSCWLLPNGRLGLLDVINMLAIFF